MMTTTYTMTESPLGRILLVGSDAGLAGLYLADDERAPLPAPEWERRDDAFGDVVAQLREYFAGERTVFDVTLDLSTGTAFQQRVWAELRAIPYGETVSYGELAHHIGQPGASRAVGLANGRNPVSIIVPCHRVIATGGGLGGYGWGLTNKSWLLDLERGQPSLVS
jgi:O-6-methylguanine DNA methyltransferase